MVVAEQVAVMLMEEEVGELILNQLFLSHLGKAIPM